MLCSKISIFGVILFNIFYCTYSEEVPTFIRERRFKHFLYPAVLHDQKLYVYYENNSTIITSGESGYEDCKISSPIPKNHWSTLGNGKMVAFTEMYTHFSILDFRDCSSHSVVNIDNDTAYTYASEKRVHAVIPHYDTFDVYSFHKKMCNPCRYNDKGEPLGVNSTRLIPGSEGHKDYFLVPMKNIADVEDGYFFSYSWSHNDSSNIKILDSKYRIVAERIIDGEYLDLSSSHGHITVCTMVNPCVDKPYMCVTPKCQLLKSDLNTTAIANVQQPDKNPTHMAVNITNLENGGAMLAMEFDYYNSGNRKNAVDIFIQQIYADGNVEPAIHFGSFISNYVKMSVFMADNREYCLMVSNNQEDGGDVSLMKCVVPKMQ